MTKENILNERYFLKANDSDKLQDLLSQVFEKANTDGVELFNPSNLIIEDENGNTAIDDSNADVTEVVIFPIKTGKGDDAKITYEVVAKIPTFEEVLKNDIGLNFLKNSYYKDVIRKISDGIRTSVISKTEYKAPCSVSEFLSVSRATTGSQAFKKLVASLIKALQAKLARIPTAQAVLTQKTMLEAMKCEDLAQTVYPFLIDKTTGKTKLDDMLKNIREKLLSAGEPTNAVDELLATRHSATMEDIEEVSDFDVDSMDF